METRLIGNKELEVGTVLATADFKLGGTGYNGREIDDEVHAELLVSGAFDYGNCTCMSFTWRNSKQEEGFDTRYSKVSPDTFTEFALEVLKNHVMETVTVEIK